MEPRKSEKPVESGGQGEPAPTRPEQKTRRFQIIKLEERIAPAVGHRHGGLRGNHNEIMVRDLPRRR
jgi:hypothetical protein